MQKITVRLPEEMLTKIERIAAESDTNRSEVTRQMVQKWLEERGDIEQSSLNRREYDIFQQ